jgi:hypothetical protein
MVLSVIFQAVDDVSRGNIKPGEKLYELKSLQESGKKLDVSIANHNDLTCCWCPLMDTSDFNNYQCRR